jgi:hypothetical protein
MNRILSLLFVLRIIEHDDELDDYDDTRRNRTARDRTTLLRTKASIRPPVLADRLCSNDGLAPVPCSDNDIDLYFRRIILESWYVVLVTGNVPTVSLVETWT